MSDTWRPFALRRDVGGDLVRAGSGWQGALRYGPQTFSFDAVDGTTLDGIPVEYDSTLLSISVPASVPSRGEIVLVRGGFGYPNSPLDGEAVFYNPDNQGSPLTDQFNQLAVDQPLTGGRWYYYSLFVKLTALAYPQPGVWTLSATKAVLVPKYYAHDQKLIDMVPPFYVRLDDQQAADGRNGPLRKFARILGYEYDYERTFLDGVLNVYSPDFAPLQFVQQVGANLGLPVESSIGGARYRALVGQLWNLEGSRGTLPGLQGLISAVSDYETIVVPGYNSLLAPDDAEFVTGVGHWERYANPHYIDMTNGVDNSHPPAGLDLSHLVLRLYTATDLLAPAGYGRGVLEVIEVTVSGGPGMYGQPGSLTGPPGTIPGTLAALQAASPPILPTSIPGYYTAPNPFWAGDYIVLADGTQAYWNGTAWVAGVAPNSGASVRPPATSLSPGAASPPGAALPADLATLQGTGLTLMNPQVEWKQGDYITLADGSLAHVYWYVNNGHNAIGWTSGAGVLTLAAVVGLLSPLVGDVPKWALSDGSSAIAPASFAALRATDTVVGKGQPGSNQDRPWDNTQSYETLHLYDNSKVSWEGKAVSLASTGSGTNQVTYPINLNTQAVQTGTDTWVDGGAQAASASVTQTLISYTQTQGISGQPSSSLNLPQGWFPLPWPAGNQNPSGTAWTNAAGDFVTWSPAAAVDVRFHAYISGIYNGSTYVNWLAGTVLALFVNGTEHSRSTADGNHSSLAHMASLVVQPTDRCEWRIYSPAAQVLYLTGKTYGYYTNPAWWIVPRPAVAANGGSWKPTVAGRYNIVVTLSPAGYSGGAPFWLMKNGVPAFNGFLNNDTAELCKASGWVNLTPSDVIMVVVPPVYYPASVYITYGSYTPRLVMARWNVVP